ncbi:enolase C-terminal domain-like protein [Taklimakanibacter deserti]|uniref:enolase C-terminal domain-like protein n=1 Tax=Taklimakanibacter deserti TaxID=2267839 RepID=UPI000E64D391
MRITDIRERSTPVSRYADPALRSGDLTTSLVMVTTDAVRAGRRVTGYGYASVGRYAQGGLMRERFIPRLLAAQPDSLLDATSGALDPRRAWDVMMAGEKPGGHGERCVAVGALDMALWDIAAKMAEEPLHTVLARGLGRGHEVPARLRIYAGGGYRYPHNDLERLADEMRRFVDQGFTHAKMKIGGVPIESDLNRIEAAMRQLPAAAHLAVDAMNAYDVEMGLTAAARLAPLGLWWFEDICDPHDFAAQARVASTYARPVAAGEALFSLPEARLLDTHGGLRRDRDFLLFDPVHCYGLTGYLRIIEHLTQQGWPRSAFWPHGGHLFSLHIAAALGLGGAEVTPFAFHPFSQLSDRLRISEGHVDLPQQSGIGFELNPDIMQAFAAAFA